MNKLELVTREIAMESTNHRSDDSLPAEIIEGFDTLPSESGRDVDLSPEHSATVAEGIAAGSVRESATEGEDSVPIEGDVTEKDALDPKRTAASPTTTPVDSSIA